MELLESRQTRSVSHLFAVEVRGWCGVQFRCADIERKFKVQDSRGWRQNALPRLPFFTQGERNSCSLQGFFKFTRIGKGFSGRVSVLHGLQSSEGLRFQGVVNYALHMEESSSSWSFLVC